MLTVGFRPVTAVGVLEVHPEKLSTPSIKELARSRCMPTFCIATLLPRTIAMTLRDET